MELLSLQFALPVLAFVAVVAMGGAVVVGRSTRQRSIQARLNAGAGQLLGPASEHQPRFYKALQAIGAVITPKGPSKGLREELARAGIYGQHAPHIFLGVKVLCFTAALSMMLALLPQMPAVLTLSMRVLLVLIGAAFGMILPNFVLTARRVARQREVQNHLPDAVDLLEICVGAGMGLDMAWRAVTDQVRRVSATLADEMSLTDLEINLGGSRAVAMRHMAERSGAQELQWLVSAFVQSERFGTSLSETLRAFAVSMREDRSRRAEEAAEKMAVRILFPLVVFIFPTIIIVCAGPAGIRIATVFGGQ